MNLDQLMTEARNPVTMDIDTLTPLEFVLRMNSEDAKVIPAVAACAETIARALEIATQTLQSGGRIIYIGAGTSGRLGVLDASECPPTFNTEPWQVVGLIAGGKTALTTAVEGAEDHPTLAESDLKDIHLSTKDVVIGIATSGRTPYVIGGLCYAKSIGCPAIGLACTQGSELRSVSDFVIEAIVGPEILTGSTRLKAGTVTKLILNTITTGAMVRLGKTYGNLMVDLRATNQKLIARTRRILRLITGISEDEANARLTETDGELKTAILVQMTGASIVDARQALKASGGRLKAAELALTPPEQNDKTYDFLLGIEGGGTKTTALLATLDGKILSEGFSGPSNMKAIGLPATQAALQQAITDAFLKLNLKPGKVRAAGVGLAGAGYASDQVMLKDWLQRVGIARSAYVCTDADLLLAMGTEPNAIAVIAGTGSAVFGKNSAGNNVRVGGYGYLLGDEGSAYQFVLVTLQRACHVYDSGDSPAWVQNVFERMQCKEPLDVVQCIYGKEWDRAKLAGLAPAFLQLIASAETPVTGILREQIRALAMQVLKAYQRLELQSKNWQVVLTGGFLLHPYVKGLFLAELDALGLAQMRTVCDAPQAVVGGIELAKRLYEAENVEKLFEKK